MLLGARLATREVREIHFKPLNVMGYLMEMSGPDEKRVGAEPLTGLQAALADVAERRRKDPNWDARFDLTYHGPFYLRSREKMTEADFAAWQVQREEERRWLRGDTKPRTPLVEQPPPRMQPVVRACLPFGERVRDLRHALGWTQRDVALHLGVSARTIIRYEQGRSSPLQSRPLLALRRLESAHAQELDACNARPSTRTRLSRCCSPRPWSARSLSDGGSGNHGCESNSSIATIPRMSSRLSSPACANDTPNGY